MKTSEIVENAKIVIQEMADFLDANSGKGFVTNSKWDYRVSVHGGTAEGIFRTGEDTGFCRTIVPISIKSLGDLARAESSLSQIGFISKVWHSIKPYACSDLLYQTEIYEPIAPEADGENFIKSHEWNWVVCVRGGKAFGYFPIGGQMAAYREITVAACSPQ